MARSITGVDINTSEVDAAHRAVQSRKLYKKIGAYSALGIVGGLSLYSFGSYFIKPDIKNELDMLRGSAAYVRSYVGDSPVKAIGYVKDSLENIADRKDINIKGLSNLEQDIDVIQQELKGSKSPLVYRPVLYSIGDKIYRLVDENKFKGKHPDDVIIGGLGSLATILLTLIFYLKGYLKD